jgi:hypothetical protein
MDSSTHGKWVEGMATAALLLIVAFQIFGPRPIGMADNGDFPKMLGPYGIWQPAGHEEDIRKYFDPEYVVDNGRVYEVQVRSIERGFIRIARGIAAAILPRGRFDLRILGVLHGLVFCVGGWLLIRATREFVGWKRVALVCLLLVVLTDIQNVQYLNTAYMDAPAVAFFVVLMGIAANAVRAGSRQGVWAVAFAVACVGFLGTKLQHAACALPFVLFAAAMFWRVRGRSRWVWLFAIAVILGTVNYVARKSPADFRADPLFGVLFDQVFPRDPAALKAFGFWPDDEKYVGVPAYSPATPMADPAFRSYLLSTVPLSKLVRYYLRHPGVALDIIRSDLARFGQDPAVRGLGKLRRQDHPAPFSSPRLFVWWSGFKGFVLRFVPLGVVALLVAGVLVGAGRPTQLLLMCVGCLAALVSLGVAALTDSSETERHLILFHLGLDVAVVFAGQALMSMPAGQCLVEATAPSRSRLSNMVRRSRVRRTESAVR